MKKFGLYLVTDNIKNKLMFDGRVISATGNEGFNAKTGVDVSDGELTVNGKLIAKASSDAKLHEENGKLFLGDVNLELSGECINITQEDYNDLLQGVAVEGYKRYDVNAVYNIVSDVSSSSTITYTIENGVITFSDETTAKAISNTLYNNTSGDLVENTLDASETITNPECPIVVVKYFNPIVPIGGSIKLDYFVDTQDNASLNYGIREDTFTVIVKTESGSTAKKTTYAGRFTIDTPAFSTGGETWFSIECIDSNGVGSAVQYFDILVRNAITPNHYVMQASDLETYGIAINDNDQTKALANKAALSNFFADVKSGEIDGSNGYNGVKMLNGTYWIDMHLVGGYGTRTYYVADVDTDPTSETYRKILTFDPCTEQDVISSGVFTTFKINCKASGATPLWDEPNLPKVGDYFIGSSEPDSYKDSDVDDQVSKHWIIDNKRYYVFNTSRYGDEIVFPDSFTVDLNGATIRALTAYDLDHGQILYLNNNFDTHIVNGNIIGTYDVANYDWETNKRWVGSPCPNEWQGITRTNLSRYCSFERLIISNSMGYDSAIGGNAGVDGTDVSFEDGFGKSIDNTGNLVNSTICSVTPKIALSSGQEEVKFGKNGYGGYNFGNHREIFFAFYNGDAFLGLVKSALYYGCKVPTNANYVRVMAYGTDGDVLNGWKTLWRNSGQSKNVTYANCTFQNDRTCAISATHSKGVCFDSCHFENIGMQKAPYSVTSMLADLEDGWQGCQNFAFINNTCNRGTGSRMFFSIYCLGMTFCNNTGVAYYDDGGVAFGFVEDNTLLRESSIYLAMSLHRNICSIHPCVIYKGNNVEQCSIGYSNARQNIRTQVIDTDVVEPIVYMEDTTIKEKCSYSDLKLRNSMNGNVWND